MKREDDFTNLRKRIKDLDDRELKERFWILSEKIVDPLIEMARKHTSPSIERSVLLRMGFSSIEAKEIVERTIENDLMGKGAGHSVYRLSTMEKCSVRKAGLMLMEGDGWEIVKSSFKRG